MLVLYVPQCRLYSKLPVQCGQRLVTWCGLIFECGRVDDLQRHMHKNLHTQLSILVVRLMRDTMVPIVECSKWVSYMP